MCGILFHNGFTVVLGQQNDDNDFAEFEDFDIDDGFTTVPNLNPKAKPNIAEPAKGKNMDFRDAYEENDDEDVLVEEDTEFEHFHDEEEFEGFAKTEQTGTPGSDEPKLTMAKVPLHFRY